MTMAKQAQKRPRVSFKKDPGRTKQAFKEECDINNILRKFQKTGRIEHMSKHQPDYGFATSDEYIDSMRLIAQANTQFAELPSELRKKFGSVQKYLEYVSDPENDSELPALFGESPPSPPAKPEEPQATTDGEAVEPKASPPTTEL